MRELFINPTDDRRYLTGLCLLVASFCIFCTSYYYVNGQEAIPFFIVNFILTLIFTFQVMGYNKSKTESYFKFKNQRYNIITVLLWTVSAYSLNRDLPVFAESVDWLNGYILLYSAALLIVSLLKEKKQRVLDYGICAVLTTAMAFHFYQTVMTVKLFPIMIMSFWLFGISFHSLVPLVSFFLCLGIVANYIKKSKKFVWAANLSLLLICTLIFSFVWQWNKIKKKSETNFVHIEQPYEGKDIPAWCALGQEMEGDWITKRILGGSNIFVVAKSALDWHMSQGKKHDPLVLIASLISGNLDFSIRERQKISSTIFNKRHQSEWKLWRDDDLFTTDIDTKIKLYPEERIAYTEKVIEIKNNSEWYRSQQEALYTFHIPDGSVVSSASLWIDGVEQESYLTTKTKADSAYKAIVGRERRDPLLVHWKEGNRVTARIFPVIPKKNRKFKIGITTPLAYQDGALTYQNMDFQGPNTTIAKENIELIVDQEKQIDIETPITFSWDMSKYTYSGLYYSDWSLNIAAPPLNSAPFSFNEKSYTMLDLKYEEKDISEFRKVYLDVNSAWSKRDVRAVLEKCSEAQIYMFDGIDMVNITSSNYKKHWKQSRKLNFSVFPIYKIADPASSLLISKNNHITPVIDDFKGSPFQEKLDLYMNLSAGQLTLLDIGDIPSQYLNSLVELKSIIKSNSTYESFIETGKVSIPKTLDAAVAINTSGTQIVETTINGLFNAAPDHLLRLYAYNNVMGKIGKEFTKRKQFEETYIKLAEEAHILSPISSMIVLETQADYDRFDIKKSKNSLGNANLDSSGAVPEPHEWALIFILLISLLVLHFKTRIA